VPEDAYDYENDTVKEKVNGDEMGVSFESWLKRDPKDAVGSLETFSINLWWDRNFYPDGS